MEKLYCSTCKEYTEHKNDICSICESVYDHSKKRYVICGPSNLGEVIAAKLKFLEENPDAIIIDEEAAIKHRLGGIPTASKEETLRNENLDFAFMRSVEDSKYSHLTKKEKEAIIEHVRVGPKVRRNDLCPCGSGLKYKKCCLNKNK